MDISRILQILRLGFSSALKLFKWSCLFTDWFFHAFMNLLNICCAYAMSILCAALGSLQKQPHRMIPFAEPCLRRLHVAHPLWIPSLCSPFCHIPFLSGSSCLGSLYLWFNHWEFLFRKRNLCCYCNMRLAVFQSACSLWLCYLTNWRRLISEIGLCCCHGVKWEFHSLGNFTCSLGS